MFDRIIVIGNGKTSRANVEALIDDYIYANPKLHIHFHYEKAMSEVQFWLKQYAEDKNLDYSISSGSEELKYGSDDSVAMFIVWSDEDPESANALVLAKEKGIPAFDFTNGLAVLVASDTAKQVKAPEIPEQEELSVKDDKEEDVTQITSKKEIIFEEDSDPLYDAIDYIAKTIAEAVAKEIKKALAK
jgi:hypothetical protein